MKDGRKTQPGMLVPREQLPDTLRFYAEEGRQEVRPSLAIARTAAASAAPTDDLFGGFGLDPAKFERLLRHTGVPLGLLTSGREPSSRST